jgi:hypothetical protein
MPRSQGRHAVSLGGQAVRTIILAAGFVGGRASAALWVVALAVDYAGALIGHGQG